MIFDWNYSYWAWFGTISLIILTYQDFKNKMLVDDRRNSFMMGITLSLITHLPINLWYILILFVFIISYVKLGKKYIKGLGEADYNSLGWILYGFGIISKYKLLWFAIFFGVISGLYILIKYIYCKILKQDFNKPTPFYPIILISYIFSCWLFALY